mgnify:CR=1 FL=1
MSLKYFNQLNYSNIAYNRPNGEPKSIATSGCGVVCATMAVDTLYNGNLYSVNSMRNLAVKSGARIYDGTDVEKLLKAICTKNKSFKYEKTNDAKKVTECIKRGGVAICNQGDAYNVFSSTGHFVFAYAVDSKGIYIADPALTPTRYDKFDRPNRIVKKTEYGCIVKETTLKRACADRNPAFFLIYYTGKKPGAKKKRTGALFTIGKVYTLKYDMKVRTSPNGSQMKYSKLTPNAKKNAYKQTYAVLKAGTKVTCNGYKDKGDYTWITIPSGYIAGYKISGKEYYVK